MGVRRSSCTVALLACLTGCAPAPEPRGGSVQEKGAAPAPHREVILDEQSLRLAGLQVESLQPKIMPERIRATARLTLNEDQTWRINSVTAGRIVSVCVKPGDVVKKGDVLAQIYSHEIHQVRAEYRRASVELKRLQANYDFAVRQVNRMRRLYELKAASLQQVESAEVDLRNAETALEAAQIELRRTTQHLEGYLGVSAEDSHGLSPLKEAGTDYVLAPVRAPEGGVVIERHVTTGAVIDSSSPLFTISDVSSVWAVLSVAEEHLPHLRTGLHARVYSQTIPGRVFRGTVSWIGEQLDPSTRTVQVRVTLDNRDHMLKPEMFGEAEIDAGVSTKALFAPLECLQEIGGETVIFVQKQPGVFEARPVTVGRRSDNRVEIRSGLLSGEAVVLRGSFILKSQLLRGAIGE